MEPFAVYAETCPICGGPINSVRALQGLPCTTCLPPKKARGVIVEGKGLEERVELVARGLTGTTPFHYTLAMLNERKQLERLFESCVGRGMWSLQRSWALRLVKGDSFALTAPTGVGKTTLLLVYALHVASKGSRVYVLVPTENLVKQTLEKLESFSRAAGLKVRIIGYRSRASKRAREDVMRAIAHGEFDVLVTTAAFLSRRFDELKRSAIRFDLVVVDDADSILKDSKNIERLLVLLGFTEEELTKAYELIRLKATYAYERVASSTRGEETLRRIEELRYELAELRSRGRRGQLVIASATGRQRGVKPKLFRELLGFEMGSVQGYVRNVIDAYTVVNDRPSTFRKTLELVQRLGKGGLVFVAKDLGIKVAKELEAYLQYNGVSAYVALSGRRALDKMASGKADVLIGVSSYYGTLVRGIDLPEKVRYAIFLGVPRFRADLEKAIKNPGILMRLAALVLRDSETFKELYREYSRLSPAERKALGALLLGRIETREGRLLRVLKEFEEVIPIVLTEARRMVEATESGRLLIGTTLLLKEGNKLYLVFPDVYTYIQASGRTSRLLEAGTTLGLAVIIEEYGELITALSERLRFHVPNSSFRTLEELDIGQVAKELTMSRESRDRRRTLNAKPVLVVVESPTKARTIAGFFGRPARRRLGTRVVAYEVPVIEPETETVFLVNVVATKGHVYDLTIDEDVGLYGIVLRDDGLAVPVYAPIRRCLKCGEQFASLTVRCPRCGEERKLLSSVEVTQALRAIAFEVDEVLIATDPDSEGEKIAWDVLVATAPYARVVRRVEFHEVTREAFLRALREARGVDIGRVAAQIYRRVSDRLLGFSVSRRLWETFGKRWLGAGRVQVPVLGWIIDRYEEWKRARGYVLQLKTTDGLAIRAYFESRDEALRAAEGVRHAKGITLEVKQIGSLEVHPSPPLTTDELIYLANRVLGLPPSVTMRYAQDLFDSGLITYHRTDSTHVSPVGIAIARTYIFEKLRCEECYQPRAWGTGGTHEAIRPTKPISADELWRLCVEKALPLPIELTPKHLRLYDIIFRRFIASQMRSSRIEVADVTLRLTGKEISLRVCVDRERGGFLDVLPFDCYPSLKGNEGVVNLKVADVAVFRGSSVQLYRGGDVVRLMRERGIGRPSTYAKTLSNLSRHGYIVETKRRNYLVPTRIGVEVYNHLVSKYGELFKEERTRVIEERMRQIEEGSVYNTRGLIHELLAELRESGLLQDTELKNACRAAISIEADGVGT